MQYLYRLLWRWKAECWPVTHDPAKNVWRVVSNKSYSTLPTTKGVRTREQAARWNRNYEYKIQRYPLTQEWEDIDD